MNTGIKFEIIWLDEHIVEVRVTASNGRFTGAADCFCAHDGIPSVAAALRGFPSSGADRRELDIGPIDLSHAGNGAKLGFRCVDRSGHAVVDVVLRTDPRITAGDAESASFSIPVEPAAIDEFVTALSAMRSVVGDVAILRSTIQRGSAAND